VNENIDADWFVFYNNRLAINGSATIEMLRIAASCLGDAITVAKEVANRCNLQLVGICQDVGVAEGVEPSIQPSDRLTGGGNR